MVRICHSDCRSVLHRVSCSPCSSVCAGSAWVVQVLSAGVVRTVHHRRAGKTQRDAELVTGGTSTTYNPQPVIATRAKREAVSADSAEVKGEGYSRACSPPFKQRKRQLTNSTNCCTLIGTCASMSEMASPGVYLCLFERRLVGRVERMAADPLGIGRHIPPRAGNHGCGKDPPRLDIFKRTATAEVWVLRRCGTPLDTK